jgi:DMSO/TMAO reductase YedYZ molybdopterin-dependent catalytic subunit
MQNKRLLTCIIIAATILLITIPVKSASANNTGLDIVNLNGNYLTLNYEQLTAMPKTIVNADLYCYGAIVTSGNWGGVQISYLLAQANETSEVGSITLTASDGYRASIPIILAMDSNTIIAYEKDGQPLNEGLRLVLPDVNGNSWIAMITTITMSTSGALAPEGLSAGLGSISGLTPAQSNPPQSQQPTATPPSITPAPTAITSPPNGNQQNHPAPTMQTRPDAQTSQTQTLLALTIGAIIFGVAVVSAFYVHKIKG